MLKSLSVHTRFVLAFIAVMFLLRLFHITNPPIEVAHNWRQTTSLMVARNFHQIDANILYPTIDETGENRGVVGMEFPAIPYAIHLLSIPLGYDHWYGRLIVLILVTVGSWYFFLLMRLYLSEKTAAWATLLYTASSLFHLGRKVMPDPAALSLVVVALYYGFSYLKKGSITHLIAYFLFAAIGTLIKIPFGLYLALLAFPFFQSAVPTSRRVLFSTTSALVLSVVGWWYFSWNLHLADEFGQWYNSGKPLSEGAQELGAHLSEVFQRFYFSAYHSYVWGTLSIVGVVYLIYKRSKIAMATSIVLLPLIVLYMMKSGSLFSHHGYYALILVPWLALCGALLLEKLPKRLAILLLALGGIESIANQQHDFFIKPEAFQKLQLESLANQVSQPDELVGLVSNANPNEFYFLNRKGWLVEPDQCTNEHLLALKNRGCHYLFVPASRLPIAVLFPKIFENDFYSVFELK
jgi:4-amino-4-deoxy-L-arabinose transferase-like glycosyltransferase